MIHVFGQHKTRRIQDIGFLSPNGSFYNDGRDGKVQTQQNIRQRYV